MKSSSHGRDRGDLTDAEDRFDLHSECLIRKIKPDAVVVQVGGLNNSDISELQKDEFIKKGELKSSDNGVIVSEDTVPTSAFEVLKKCFLYKIAKETYEEVAGSLVLREIFGVIFNGHFIAAKKAAKEVGSSFLMLESPFVKCSEENVDLEQEEEGISM